MLLTTVMVTATNFAFISGGRFDEVQRGVMVTPVNKFCLHQGGRSATSWCHVTPLSTEVQRGGHWGALHGCS